MNQEPNRSVRRRELPTDAVPHRLFHTMVVLGSSLAAACGGSVEADDGNVEGGGGSGGAPSGGASATGGMSATGGWIATSGGAESTGGSSAGGARAYELECASSQISCENDWTCDYVENARSIFDLEQCICDLDKPSDVAACPEDHDWVCLAMKNAADEVVPFDCSCQPHQDQCGACGANREAYACDPEETGRSVLCGCTIVVLR